MEATISTHPLTPEELNKYVVQLIERQVPASEIGRVVEAHLKKALEK